MRLTLVLIAILPFVALAQTHPNLVVNPGFERMLPPVKGSFKSEIKKCRFSGNPDGFRGNAMGWNTYDLMTPDLLLYDTADCILPKPHSGQNMLGLIMHHPFQDAMYSFDYHELVQGTLSKPMEKGQTYRISFWVRSDDSLGVMHLNQVYGRSSKIQPLRCGNFGFWFSTGKITTRENFMVSQTEFPIQPHINYGAILETNGKWHKISMVFKADQPYKYFLFGNFFSDAVTPVNIRTETRAELDANNAKLEFWQKTKRIAYYLFDDFSISIDTGNPMELALRDERRYTFDAALLFNSGQSTLLPAAFSGLDELASILLKNPDMRIEIGGHTDNVGDERSNLRLSEARAQAVANYLKQKNVPLQQYACKGYGTSRPAASNDNESGRQQNRRVTVVMSDE
jgi:outer membrane protein OmpA-like peptidoglycan-associated protein